MGKHLDGLRAKISQSKGDNPTIKFFKRGSELLLLPYYIGDDPHTTDPAKRVLPPDSLGKNGTHETAEEVVRLRALKELANKFKEAVDEHVKEVELELNRKMNEIGPRKVTTDDGTTFIPSYSNTVRGREELGKWGADGLQQWFIDNGMPNIARGSINARAGAGAVRKWMEDNPIEVLVTGDVDDEALEGQKLLDALDLADITETVTDEAGNTSQVIVTAQEQLDRRIAAHAEITRILDIGREPIIRKV